LADFVDLSDPAGVAQDSGAPEPDDKLHDECGVFGVWAPGRDVARMTYFALRALQHRGQESAGIAVGDGKTVLVRKDLGLVTQVFSDADLAAMPGHVACGHCRYGTAGAKGWEAAQPHLSTINNVIIALAHNGTLVNFDDLRRELIDMAIPFRSNTDSEVAAKLIGYFTQRGHRLRTGIAHTMRMIEGGYAMVLVRENALYAFRDPHGIRPLVLGRLGDGGWVVASETCALDISGATFVREIEPGEIIRISDDGLRSERGCRPLTPANCIFEHVYFSRPDSVKDGSSFYLMRHRMGARLAQEAPVEADLVISVPDSGTPAAEGFAQESGIPFGTGLIKNRYVARTFIQPTPELRQMGVRLKLNALPDVVRGKRLVMVDDSVVRGTTSLQIVRMLKEAGATEVHVRSASPMVTWPCFYGIDTANQDQLIAANMDLEQIRSRLEADSVAFLSTEGLFACVPPNGYCTACVTGAYPVQIPRSFYEEKFLPGYEPNNLAPASKTSQMTLVQAEELLGQEG
jgi:amidophosphoribosyltransferase